MRVLVLAIVLGCGPPASERVVANTIEQPDPCAVARTRSTRAITAAKLDGDRDRILAQVSQCWPDGSGAWAIALDTLCVISPPPLDNSEVEISIVGRWVVMYIPASGVATTYVPHSYTGESEPCIDYNHPGNIAATDAAHLVGAFKAHVRGESPELELESESVFLQDHPEMDGTSLSGAANAEKLRYRKGEILSRSLAGHW